MKIPTYHLLPTAYRFAKTPTYHLPPTTYRFTKFSRRTFLSVATGAVATMLPVKTPSGRPDASASEPLDCVLIDAPEHDALPESPAGYRSALAVDGVRFSKTSAAPLPYSNTIIVPACLAPCSAVTQEIAVALKRGSRVVLESGAGFATRSEFAAHQEWLRELWNIRVERPVDLWRHGSDQPGDQRSQGSVARGRSPLAARPPYVDFQWPYRAKIRDFSRVVPVSAFPEQVVASCERWLVASRHNKGKGTLVFLGSPLGPALLAGDAEAHRWLRAVIALPGS